MPVVRRYTQQVDFAPLPGVRRTAAATPESEGAGVELAKGRFEAAQGQAAATKALGKAQTFGAVADVSGKVAAVGLNAYADIMAKARKRAFDAALLSAKNELDAWKSKNIFDSKTGALAVKGAATLDLHGQVMPAFDEAADAIGSKLATPELKAYWANTRSNERARIELEVQRHTAAETDEAMRGEAATFQTNRVVEAIRYAGEPKVFRASLDAGLQSVDSSASIFRMGPEQVVAKKLAMTTAAHVGAINNYLAQDKDSTAAAWFTAAKSEISPDRWDELQTRITDSNTQQTAQREGDRIVASGGPRNDQLTEAAKIENPKTRRLVEQQIEHAWVLKKGDEEALIRQQSADAYNLFETSKWNLAVVRKLPYWSTLPMSVRDSFEDKAALIAKRNNVVDPDVSNLTYYRLSRLIGAPKDPAHPENDFENINLPSYLHQLDEVDFKELTRLQRSLREKDQAAIGAIPGFLSRKDIFDKTIEEFKIYDAALVSKISRDAVRWVDQWQAREGKSATNEEFQSFMDEIVRRAVLPPDQPSVTYRRFTSPVLDAFAAGAALTIANVPVAERTRIEVRLRALGQAVTPDAIVNWYLRAQRLAGEVK